MDTWTARAETLAAEAAAHGADASGMCARARATGLDPDAYRGLIGAAAILGCPPGGGPGGKRFDDDHDFATALDTLESDLAEHASQTARLGRNARSEHTAAHHRLDNAVTEQERRAASNHAADLDEAIAILKALHRRVRHAQQRLAVVPDEIGGTYLEVYRLVKAGRVLPYDGRWLETV